MREGLNRRFRSLRRILCRGVGQTLLFGHEVHRCEDFVVEVLQLDHRLLVDQTDNGPFTTEHIDGYLADILRRDIHDRRHAFRQNRHATLARIEPPTRGDFIRHVRDAILFRHHTEKTAGETPLVVVEVYEVDERFVRTNLRHKPTARSDKRLIVEGCRDVLEHARLETHPVPVANQHTVVRWLVTPVDLVELERRNHRREREHRERQNRDRNGGKRRTERTLPQVVDTETDRGRRRLNSPDIRFMHTGLGLFHLL